MEYLTCSSDLNTVDKASAMAGKVSAVVQQREIYEHEWVYQMECLMANWKLTWLTQKYRWCSEPSTGLTSWLGIWCINWRHTWWHLWLLIARGGIEPGTILGIATPKLTVGWQAELKRTKGFDPPVNDYMVATQMENCAIKTPGLAG